MAAPLLGIPALYELLVGSGLLVGGAVTAQQMQKQIESNPELVQEALQRIFTGPTSEIVNQDLFKNIQAKPTTDQGTKPPTAPTEISPDDEMNLYSMSATPSGLVLGPTTGEIEKQRQEAMPKPLITVPEVGEIKPLITVPEKINVGNAETFPGQVTEKPQQISTPIPGKEVDMSILTKDKVDPSKFLAKDKNTKQYIEATNPVKIFGNQDLRAKNYSKEVPAPIEYRFNTKTYQKVYDDSLKEINDKVNVDIPTLTKKFGMKAPDINLINKSLEAAQNPDERYWYQKSGAYLKNLVTTIDPNATPKDIADFIDIVSVTSGGVEPKQNLKLALGVYSDMKQNQPILTGFKTSQSLDKYLSNKEQAINTPKFGNFTDTMKYFAGAGDREPNVVNDLQMAKLFGVKPDQLASNPELYNAMTTVMNNITKEVNKNLPEGQELQPFELQSLMWSQSRGMASNYEQVGQELIQELSKQGINIETDVMKPDFAERLQKTITPYKEAMKATIEVGSFLTPQGKQIEQLINQYGTDERLMNDINTIHRRHLKSLITKQAKQPSVMEEVLSNVLGQKVEVSRMQEGIGTYEGKANYNVIVPLTVNTSKGPRPLTDEERLSTLALLGKNLNQAAMAASNFKAGEVTEGRMATGQIYVKSPVDQAKIQELHKITGYDYNITPVAGGFVGSVISFDGAPDEAKIQKGFEKVFGKDAEMDYIDSSWKGDYLEANDYDRYINGIQKSDIGGMEEEGSTRKYRRDLDSITKKIQDIATARDTDYANLAGSNYVQKLGQVKFLETKNIKKEKIIK